jgi:hypothetical protein
MGNGIDWRRYSERNGKDDLYPVARIQYEMDDSIEESQNCTVEESVKNRERRGRFVSLGFTSGVVGVLYVEWMT